MEGNITKKITRKLTTIKGRMTDTDLNNLMDHLIERDVMLLDDKKGMAGKSISDKVDMILDFVFKANACQDFLDILNILNFHTLVTEIENSQGIGTKPKICQKHGQESTVDMQSSPRRNKTKLNVDATQLEKLMRQCTFQALEIAQHKFAEDINEINQRREEDWIEMDKRRAEERKEMDQRRADDIKEMDKRRAEDLKEMDQRRAHDLKQMEQRHLGALKDIDDKRAKEAAKLDMELRNLSNKLEENEQKMLAMQNQLSGEYTDLEKKRKELERNAFGKNQNQEQKRLKTDIAALTRRQNTLESEIHSLKQQKRELEEKIEQLKEENQMKDELLRREQERVKNIIAKQRRANYHHDDYMPTYCDSERAGERRFAPLPALMYSKYKSAKK